MSANNKRHGSIPNNPDTTAPGTAKSDEYATDDEEFMPPLTSTEGLAMRLLNPKVHSAEAHEYASYVDQYRNLNLSNELQYEHSAVDMELYEQGARLATGHGALSGLLKVDPRDVDLYSKHIISGQVQIF